MTTRETFQGCIENQLETAEGLLSYIKQHGKPKKGSYWYNWVKSLRRSMRINIEAGALVATMRPYPQTLEFIMDHNADLGYIVQDIDLSLLRKIPGFDPGGSSFLTSMLPNAETFSRHDSGNNLRVVSPPTSSTISTMSSPHADGTVSDFASTLPLRREGVVQCATASTSGKPAFLVGGDSLEDYIRMTEKDRSIPMAIGRSDDGGQPFPVVVEITSRGPECEGIMSVYGSRDPDTVATCRAALFWVLLRLSALAVFFGLPVPAVKVATMHFIVELTGLSWRKEGRSIGLAVLLAIVGKIFKRDLRARMLVTGAVGLGEFLEAVGAMEEKAKYVENSSRFDVLLQPVVVGAGPLPPKCHGVERVEEAIIFAFELNPQHALSSCGVPRFQQCMSLVGVELWEVQVGLVPGAGRIQILNCTGNRLEDSVKVVVNSTLRNLGGVDLEDGAGSGLDIVHYARPLSPRGAHIDTTSLGLATGILLYGLLKEQPLPCQVTFVFGGEVALRGALLKLGCVTRESDGKELHQRLRALKGKVHLIVPEEDKRSLADCGMKRDSKYLSLSFPRDFKSAIDVVYENERPQSQLRRRSGSLGFGEPSEYGVYLNKLNVRDFLWESALTYVNRMIAVTKGREETIGRESLSRRSKRRKVPPHLPSQPAASSSDPSVPQLRPFDANRRNPMTYCWRAPHISAGAYLVGSTTSKYNLGKTDQSGTAATSSDWIVPPSIQALVDAVTGELVQRGLLLHADFDSKTLFSVSFMDYDGDEASIASKHKDPEAYSLIIGITLEGSMNLRLHDKTSPPTDCIMGPRSAYVLYPNGCRMMSHSVDHPPGFRSSRKALVLRFVEKSLTEELEAEARAREEQGQVN